jgi:hypothetical protein
MSAARQTEVRNLRISSCREEDWVTVQQNNVRFSTWFLVAALAAGLVLVGCDSSSSEPPGSTANGRAVPDVDTVAAWCEPALAEFGSRVPLEPTSLLDGLESVPTTDMSNAIVEEINSALAQSRLELEVGSDSDGGYEWSTALLVNTINEMCGTNLESVEVAASPQT